MEPFENPMSDSAECAWRTLVRELLFHGTHVPATTDPLSVGSRFGSELRGTREMLATRSVIRNTRDRLIFSRSRRFRLDYAIAQFIWTLSGSDAVGPVAFYNPLALRFSDDGQTVRSAIGPRLFGGGEESQFRTAIEKLRADITTRRALLQVFLPTDLTHPTKDVSCTGSLHLLVRERRLWAIAHMRSQSALMVLPYDLFLLTMIHEMAATCVGLEPGPFLHVCNSAHVYEDEVAFAVELLADSSEDTQPMPAMPLAAVVEIDRAIEAEGHIRKRLAADPRADPQLEAFGLTSYWWELLLSLTVAWKLRQQVHWEEAGVDRLPDPYRRCLQASAARDISSNKVNPA
jgi:thymidylate synthase